VSEPTIERIYETVVYGDDLKEMTRFYADVLGLRLIDGPDSLVAAFRVADGGVLLMFDPSQSGVPGRAAPSHGSAGRGHIAFTVPGGALDRWRDRFRTLSVTIEREVDWGDGACSIYVRDPAGNSVELTEHELWPA